MEQKYLDFIFRRAYRHGQVCAADLEEAFGLSARTAARHLKDALCSNLLIRKNRLWLMVAPYAINTPPPVASEEDLLKFLRTPETRNPLDPSKPDPLFFQLTGLRASELSLTRADWLDNTPMKSGILTNIIRSLQSNHSIGLEISYVGLGRGETRERGWQRIIPLSLQVIGDQYSLYALRYAKLDVENKRWIIAKKDEAVPRTFVLSRIVEAKQDKDFKPRQYTIPYSQETTQTQAFALNDSLTEDQKAIVKHELKMVDDKVTLPQSSMFQFKRFYSDFAASAHAVWPPLKNLILGDDK